MYPITPAVKALFDAEQKQILQITGIDRNGTQIGIFEDSVVLGSFSIDRYSCNGEKLEVGTAIAAEMTLTLDNYGSWFDNVVFEGTELYVQIGIADWSQENPDIYWMPCGRFTPDVQPRQSSGTRMKIRLNCLDRMTRFDLPVDVTALTFPATVGNLVGQVCALCDMTQGGTTGLPNVNVSIAGLPDSIGGITYRDIIRWCAGVMGTNAWIDWTGQLVFSWYNSSSGMYTMTPSNRFDSDYYEDDLTITGVTYTDASGVKVVEGTDDYAIDLTGNPLVGPVASTVLPALYTALGGYTYRPLTATVVNAPYLWPMDRPVYYDKDGNSFYTTLTNVNFGVNGTTGLESKGLTAVLNARKQPSGVTKDQAQLINEAMGRVETDIDNSLTQQDVFDRLTDNGTAQGLVLNGGQLYVNANYIQGTKLSDYTLYNSVADLGLTSGSATLSDAFNAMGMNAILICPAGEFAAADMPNQSQAGTVEIVIPSGASRAYIRFFGKTQTAGDWRMYLTSNNVPTGTWVDDSQIRRHSFNFGVNVTGATIGTRVAINQFDLTTLGITRAQVKGVLLSISNSAAANVTAYVHHNSDQVNTCVFAANATVNVTVYVTILY